MAKMPNIGPKVRSLTRDKGSWIIGGSLLIASAALTWVVPIVGGFLAHPLDRMRNGMTARRELKARANWYRDQVGKTLGIDPSTVTVEDLKQAAKINPALGKVVNDVEKREGKDNRDSLIMAGVAAIPVVGQGAKTVADVSSGAKLVAGAATTARIGTAGKTAVAGAQIGTGVFLTFMSKAKVEPHEVAEVINSNYIQARQQGLDARKSVTPHMLFMLRVTQNEELNQSIEKQFGKKFHQMTDAEQENVMRHMPDRAQAATAEAQVVASGFPVQELMMAPPNLNGTASRFRQQAQGSFASRIDAERAAQAQGLVPAR